MKKTVFIALSLFIFSSLFAESLSPTGGVRERFESLDGMNKKAYGDDASLIGRPDDTLLVSRLKLGFIYTQTPDIIYTAIGYFASVYGWSLDHNDFKKVSGNETYWMDPQEDFDFTALNVKVKNLVNVRGLSLQLGRESNRYGDKRVLGPGSWGNSYGWLWDLAKFSYRFDDNFIDTFYGQTKDKDKNHLSLFRKHVYEGAGIYTHFKTDNKGAVEPFVIYKKGLYNGAGNGQNTQENYTYGLRAYDDDFHSFNYDLTYAKANGTIKEKNYDAYGYVAKMGYKFKSIALKPNIVFGRIYASGDDNPHDNTVKTFRTPFGGTDGSLYGRMDIMKWSNLIENVVELHLIPQKNMQLKLSYHDFSLADANDAWSYYKKYNINGNHESKLGDEYDLEYKWHYNKALEYQAIYAYFNAGAFVTKNVADNNAQRLFLQVTYNF
ncbi:alginate export family protein [Sulfurimonas sp.]|uniref:alginate export family protein n=1 Tax=Sulfurimonas sp. TaxID=2022749 RepID=UPI0026042331|nr:alginate export family protein [Sulfurimonas sp.]